MDHHEVGRLWESNAEAWTAMTRAGYDHARIHLNTPAFLEMLPDVAGQHGLESAVARARTPGFSPTSGRT